MKPSLLSLLAKALSKAEDKLPEKKAIKPGEHVLHGQALVELDCVIRKAEPTEATPRYAPDWPRVLAAVASRLSDPFSRAISCEEIAEQVYNSLVDADHKHWIPTEIVEHVEAACERFLSEKAKKAKKVPKEGPTNVVGTVTIVDFKEAA